MSFATISRQTNRAYHRLCPEKLRKKNSGSKGLRGSTPFQGVIFYLWTDLNDICTAYVKLNSKIFLFMELFLDFGMVFEKI